MDYVGVIIEGAIALGEYLASLPEADRAKIVAQLRSQITSTAIDRQALTDELEQLKKDHAALKAQLAQQTPPQQP